MATNLIGLALLYQAQGRYAEAEPLYQRSLAILEKVLGPAHPHVATNLNNLAGLYEAQGHYAEAESFRERSLAIRQAGLRMWLWDIPMDSEWFLAGRKDIYRNLWTDIGRFGPRNPRLATSLNHLALLYSIQGRYGAAEPLYERALAIKEEVLGPDHPSTATSMENYAVLLRETGRDAEAAKMEARAKSIRAKR